MLEEQQKLVKKINKEGKISPQLLKESLRLYPDRAQLIEEFSRMTPPRIIPLKGPDKLLGLIDSSIQKQEDSVRRKL